MQTYGASATQLALKLSFHVHLMPPVAEVLALIMHQCRPGCYLFDAEGMPFDYAEVKDKISGEMQVLPVRKISSMYSTCMMKLHELIISH